MSSNVYDPYLKHIKSYTIEQLNTILTSSKHVTTMYKYITSHTGGRPPVDAMDAVVNHVIDKLEEKKNPN